MHKFIEQSTISNLSSIMNIYKLFERKGDLSFWFEILKVLIWEKCFFIHALKIKKIKIDHKFCHNMSRRHKNVCVDNDCDMFKIDKKIM